MPARILSRQNPKIKYLSKLASQTFRQKEGRFLIEGVKMVEEVMVSGWLIKVVVYSPELMTSSRGKKLLEEVRAKGIVTWEITDSLLAGISDLSSPQGVLAVVQKPYHSLEDLLPAGRIPLLVLVDQVQDPGNLGTIIRVADAAGATGVILFKGTVDLYNPKVLRATMGSLFHLPVLKSFNQQPVLSFLVEAGIQLLASDPHSGIPIYKADLTRPVALIVGNETSGIRREAKNHVKLSVCIPMLGQAESLNVAVAVGIMLYEAVRQRGTI